MSEGKIPSLATCFSANSTVDKTSLRAPPNSAVKRWSLPEYLLTTPPVCAVNPGRVLELTTTIGISQYNNIFSKRAETSSDYTSDPFHPSGKRGQLKSGRLRPLNLHCKPELTSQTCLGVVSVKQKKPSSQHHRSLTAPVSRPHTRQFDTLTRRTSSAMSSTLKWRYQSMNVRSTEPSALQKPFQPDLLPQKPLILPPVISRHSEAHSNSNDGQIEVAIADSSKLSSSSETKEEPIDKEMIPLEINTSGPAGIGIPAGENPSNKKRRKKLSGLAESKLSYGWTQAQPIHPLVGTLPPVTDTKRIRENKRNDSNRMNSNDSADTIDKDRTCVDVEVMLQQNNSETVIST